MTLFRLLALAVVGGAAIIASAVPAFAAVTPAEITPTLAERIDAAVRATTGDTKGSTPATSVAIVEHGRIVYARSFGVADRGAKTAVTPQTRFRIASVTKMFTAIAVLQQVEKGTVRLDAPLATYLPDAPHAHEVTVRQLMMHTSGLWNYGDEAFRTGRVATPTTPQAIVAWAATMPLAGKPGDAFVYSNTGYVLLGEVVEAVTHRSLAAYEQENILARAAMTETTFGDAPLAAPLAHGYLDATGATAAPYSPSWFYADGDIVSTATDIARFDAALMGGRLITPASFAQMQSSAVLAPSLGATVKYGLGVMLAPFHDVTFIGHHGGLPDYVAETEMLPAEGFAIVVLGNAGDFATARVNAAVFSLVLPALFTVPTGPASAGEDAAVTAKLRTLIDGLLHGTVDRATLTPTMNAAITPQSLVSVAAQLAPLGTLRTLIYRGKQSAGGLEVYHYVGTFASGTTLPITLSIDPKDGAIAGFFFA